MQPVRRAEVVAPRVDPHQRLMAHVLCLALVLSVAVPVKSNGFVLGTHVLAFGCALGLAGTVRQVRGLRWLWLTAGVWLGAQSVSNLLNHAQMTAAVGFMGLLVLSISTLLVWLNISFRLDLHAVVLFFAVGWLVLEVVNFDAFESLNPWKYALAGPVVVLVGAALALAGATKTTTAVVFLLISAVSLSQDARFFAFMALVVALFVAARGRSGHPDQRGMARRVALGLLALGLAGYFAYPTAAASGALGDRAQIQQAAYDASGANFLLDNRAEFFQAGYIVVHAPPMGVGAKRAVDEATSLQALQWLAGVGVDVSPARAAYLLNELPGRPVLGYAPHSGMLDSVIQGGLLAFPFWLLSCWLILRRIVTYRGSAGGRALLTYVGGLALWNAFFSPLEAGSALTLSVALALALAPTREPGEKSDAERRRSVAVHGPRSEPVRVSR